VLDRVRFNQAYLDVEQKMLKPGVIIDILPQTGI